MALWIAIDAAYPPDYTQAPPGTKAILGYVGESGPAANIWDLDAVHAARAFCGHWWPIWFPPQGVLSIAEGARAASSMISVLPGYGVAKDDPVFLDIEHDSWVANPDDALGCVRAWRQAMNAAGYEKAYAYVPAVAGFDWIADWVDSAPKKLPAGVIGQQYAGNVDEGRYDMSVFDSSLWGSPQEPPDPTPGNHAAPDDEDNEDDDMDLVITADGTVSFIADAGLKSKRALPTQTDKEALEATQLYKQVTVSQQLLDAIPLAT